MIFIIRFSVLVLLNYGVLLISPYIDTLQLVKDLNLLFEINNSDLDVTYFITSFSVSGITLLLIRIFKPFIEIYLLHYSRYFFNVLVCLLGLSSVYIILRVYGYSRVSLSLYVFASSLFLTYSGKIFNIGK